jgi:hypothetical protein
MDLAYNLAFHLRSEVFFDAGQSAILHALHQSLTYGGWLEGRPWREWNDRVIARSLSQAEQHCPRGAKPVLIPPERSTYLHDPSENEIGREFRRHEPEWLPAVTCVAVLHGSVARDQSKHIGVLTVVWFQGEYAPPIAEPYATQLAAMDWRSLATDVLL